MWLDDSGLTLLSPAYSNCRVPSAEYFEIVNKDIYFMENMRDIYFDINQFCTLPHPQESVVRWVLWAIIYVLL